MRSRQPIALTVAGSDSGGGAGIQADLKVFSALGVHGVTAITALTAQNPTEVRSIHPVPPRVVVDQIEAIWAELVPAVVKTGMLVDERTIRAVATCLERLGPVPLVVDPIMISTSGKRLLSERGARALQKLLFPLASLITPNRPEAECLLGTSLKTITDLRSAAREFVDRFGVPVVMKGGHVRSGGVATDVFWDGRQELLLESPYLRGFRTHGTGCTFSAAIAGLVASGFSLCRAVEGAKVYTTTAIRSSVRIGRHFALGPGMEGGQQDS